MVSVVNVDPKARTAEMVLPNACLVCGNDVHLRLSPGDARTWCVVCHLSARPKISWAEGGMTLEYDGMAQG